MSEIERKKLIKKFEDKGFSYNRNYITTCDLYYKEILYFDRLAVTYESCALSGNSISIDANKPLELI